jgi:hypothetical protein
MLWSQVTQEANLPAIEQLRHNGSWLNEARRMPERQSDGTATWSLCLLKQRLRQASDGLPQVSTYTIQRILHEAGYTWQENRSWCETGQVKRKRKTGTVTVTDPDTVAKKT